MDSGRLPAYRSSYLLRFHPYARVKLSVRERIMALSQEDEMMPIDFSRQEEDISFKLDHAIHDSGVHDDKVEVQSRQRRLSMSSLVIDLALLLSKRLSLQDKDK